MSRQTRSPQDQAAYWSQWLSADRSPTELPLFVPRPPAPSYYRESISERIGASEVQALGAALSGTSAPLYVGLLSAFSLVTSRYGNGSSVLVGVVAGATHSRSANPLPFDLELDGDFTSAQLIERVAHKLAELADHGDYEADHIAARRNATVPAYRLMFRSEGLASVIAEADADTDPGSHGAECDVVLTASADGDSIELRLEYDGDLFDQDAVRPVLAAYRRALQTLSRQSGKLSEFSLLSDGEQRRVLEEWNNTAIEYPRELCIHQLFERQVVATPDAIALAFCSEELSYRQLNERANQLAHELIGRGVGPDSIVGLWLERGVDLLVSVLAVHKAGGAYVPMDPHYPRDRVTHMAVDSGTQLVLTDSNVTGDLNAPDARVLRLQDLRADIARRETSNPNVSVSSNHLAYVIYTSGSTGKPKGVMVEHRNAVNFFAGMDQSLDHKPGVWLAVTSLSFDISVLELLWTLTRGFKVVIFSASQQREPEGSLKAAPNATAPHGRAMDFDIFYFGSDEGIGKQPGRERYRLFIEAAKFGDRNGFKGVWTPERHFDTFGGLYPSPAVQGGALSMITDRIQIRAGSVVLPLHDTVRVAEELQLVDNLSNGRVGVAFTTGWQPDDFVLAPQSYQARAAITYDGIKLIHNLWKGEATTRKNGVGKDFEFRTLPRPVQPELPSWLTCGGGIHGFIKAGELGLNVLTHLLGQTIEELTEKLAAYRKARKDAGHAGDGYVSLMLHTFVSDDAEAVKPIVHGPLKDYLKGSQQLFAGFAKELGIDMNNLTDADRETLAEFSFRRYYETSGLFGTPESCKPLIERLMAAGVGSIACLIDFGIEPEVVLNSLPHLNRLREMCQSLQVSGDAAPASDDAPYSIQGLIGRHAVTHLQCTPSMCFMLLADPAAKAALGTVHNLMIGGEAFPARLASQLREINSSSRITNMYGPTETTIWSSTHPVEPNTGEIPIGKPIANTGLYVLDAQKRPVPAGVVGELYIGGDGVARGYLNRADLTAERFVADPFVARSDARMYRTGDLARFRRDGVVEFLGRGDNQIKFRGFRIEMGEIETAILSIPGVAEVVAMVREDVPGDQRLVAYLVAKKGEAIEIPALRERLKSTLTEFMVPTAYVVLAAMPLTPNAKIDRKALPAPDASNEVVAAGPRVEPSSQLEEKIAEVWKKVLKLNRVGVNDNFFDLGGHSVLVVQVLNTLREDGHSLAMTDLFQYPTIRTLAAHINPDEKRVTGAKAGADRAAARKARMVRR